MRQQPPRTLRLTVASTALALSAIVVAPALAGPDLHGVNERPRARLFPSHEPGDRLNPGPPPGQHTLGDLIRGLDAPVDPDAFGQQIDDAVPPASVGDFGAPDLIDLDNPIGDLGDGVAGDHPLVVPTSNAVPVPGALPVLVVGALLLRRRRRA